ncbi:putative ferric reductase transmembrane component [Spathaspora sp. JA1]|nr:putative ferric reductase transmembrane component [Spathaspora sp. JA1]
MNLLNSLYLLIFFIIGAKASAPGIDWYTPYLGLYACLYEVDYSGNFTFCPANDTTCLCSNENSRATMAGCLVYQSRNTTTMIDYIVNYCSMYFSTDLKPTWFEEAIELYEKKAKYLTDIELPADNIVDIPLKFEPKDMDYFAQVALLFLGNYDDSVWYGVSVYGFWFLVLLVGTISHWTKMLFPSFTKKLTGPVSNFYRKHISMPALYGRRKAQSLPGFKVFDSLIPARFEMIVIALFYIFMIVVHTINMKGVKDDPVFGSTYLAELRYVADRTGIVGTAIMPLVFLFAGRNNFLQWICGFNYQTFLCYHRHLARVMFMLIVIHSVNFTILEKDYFASDMQQTYFYWGVIATIVGGLMLIQSILFLRRINYELFLIVHIVLAAFWVAGSWVHMVDFGYGCIFFPAIAVWCFDRLVRLVRLFYFGFPEVNLQLVADETIKLTIPKPKHWPIIPGGHAFIYFMKPRYFWQSHPFTFTSSVQEDNNIVMYIKLKGGVTHSLYKLLNKSPGKTVNMRVGVEGPYGESTPAKYADKAVFIAGGNGIPGIYSEISDIASRSSKERKSVLKLIWVIREYKSLVWFHEELMKLKDTNIDTTVYVTRPNVKLSNIEELKNSESSKEGSIEEITKSTSFESEDFVEQLKDELSHIHFEEGRPNIEQFIQEEIKESPGSIAFVACGHPKMVDEVLYLFYLLFLFANGTNADEKLQWYKKHIGLYSCLYPIFYLEGAAFCPDMDETCICSNDNSRATIAGCLAYKDRVTSANINFFIQYCEMYYETSLDEDWYDKSLARFNDKAKFLSEIDLPADNIPHVPLRFESKDMDYYAKVAINFLGNYDDSIWYGVSVFGFWLIVLIIGAVRHWSKVLFPEISKNLNGPISNFYRKYISTPALYGRRKTQSLPGFKVFDSLIPARIEMIVIALFYIFITIINAVNIQAVKGDPIWGSKYMAEIRYVADRTGIIGTVMMPLVFLFSGRNNFLQWFCGINSATSLCYHRHTARVMFILIAIHSVTYTINYGSEYVEELEDPWLYWGLIATIIGGLMLIQSILFLRRNYYEVFLVVHIVMAVLYVVGTWIHIVDLGYGCILYPSIAVWCFDRLIRLVRLFYFGFPEVTLKLVADETIKLTIPKPKHWPIIPGGHAFIYFMKPKYFWQSHPFTFTSSVQEDNNIVMYIKLKGGITHRLYKLLNKSPGKTVNMRVGVEGPYGESTPAKYADKAVFIAGGNGIPGIYSEVSDIALRSSKERKSVLKLIWVIREYKSLTWFHEELLKLKETNIDTTIYVTRPDVKLSNVEDLKNSESSKEGSIELTKSTSFESDDFVEQLKDELSHIHFEEGRPNIEQLLQEEIKESPGSIAFVTCGHPIMVDEIRYYCCKNIGNPEKKRIDFYEQLQVTH